MISREEDDFARVIWMHLLKEIKKYFYSTYIPHTLDFYKEIKKYFSTYIPILLIDNGVYESRYFLVLC